MRRPRTRYRHVQTWINVLTEEQLAPRRDRPVSLHTTTDNLALVTLDELSVGRHLTSVTHLPLAHATEQVERDLLRGRVTVVG